eukprot:GILI01011675.1.p1 GENE.GILI01011675.1~~GILI01011675.1.p1  ORF type:complete len:344 (-),score=75.75 GILI01011675.1:236-1267(-)
MNTITDHPYLTAVGGAYIAFVAYCKYYHSVNKTGTMVKRPLDGPKSPPLYHISGDLMTRMIYKEIYLDRCYFKHGITLEGVKDPFILDIGGNTGFFSRWCAETFPTGRVHVAEPIPLLQQCIDANTKEFKGRVTLHKCGISNERSSAEFTFMPTTSAGSSMFVNDLISPMDKYPLMERVRGLVSDGQHVYPSLGFIFRPLAASMRVPVLNILVLIFVLIPLVVLQKTSQAASGCKDTKVKCELMTVDQMLFEDVGKIREDEVKSIDLLKIDVEAAEWVVLMGISDKLWPKIKQVVVEVTDVDNRVDKIVSLFKEKGFKNITVDIEDWESHKLLDIKTIFATRN